MNEKLFAFTLLFSLLFPVFAYGLTNFSEEIDYDITLDRDSLIMAGITLSDAQSHNVTFDSDFQYFLVQNMTIRVKWFNEYTGRITGTYYGDGLVFQKQSPLGRLFNNWWFNYVMWVSGSKMDHPDIFVSNVSMVNQWEKAYNWSRFSIEGGYTVFITPQTPDLNITESVMTTGIITVTIGEGFREDYGFNFQSFTGWYIGLMIGDQSWGLPPFFSWILRIMSALMIWSAVMLAKELIKL